MLPKTRVCPSLRFHLRHIRTSRGLGSYLYPAKLHVNRTFTPFQCITQPFPRAAIRWQSYHDQSPGKPSPKSPIRENIYTIPNVLTVSRIFSCPVLGWSIVNEYHYLAFGLLIYAGLTDFVDGYLARRYKMKSVLGTILDPAADKALMATLTISLAMRNSIPLPLAVIIIGRDILLSLSAFYIRYTSLEPPKTFKRYWDFSMPSVEVRPTFISKVNTALQLLLMAVATVHPILQVDLDIALQALHWTVATTTIWSGLSYALSNDAVRVLGKRKHPQ